jgi:F-type H+-transporting ATPase subunit b
MRRGRLDRSIVAATFLATLTIAVSAGMVVAARTAYAEGESAEHATAQAVAVEDVGAHGKDVGELAEHTPAISGKSLALQLLNFGVLLAILIKFGGGAINKALAGRHEQLKAELAAASAARAEAEGRLRKQEARLSGLEREIEAMRAGIKQEAEVEKARLIAAAEERAKRVREETAFVIAQQIKEAQVIVRRDVAENALRIAEEILRRAIDANDQRRLLDGFVKDVTDGAGDAAGRTV